MKNQLVCSLLLFCFFALANEKQDINQEIVTFFKSIAVHEKNKNFQTKACDLQKEKWLELLFTQKSFEGKISFNKNCDLEGAYKPLIGEFFPFEMKIRKHPTIKNAKGQIKIYLSFTQTTLLNIDMKSTYLSGKNKVAFDGNYRFEVDPLSPDQFIKRNLGGDILITELNGKKMNEKIKLPAF